MGLMSVNLSEWLFEIEHEPLPSPRLRGVIFVHIVARQLYAS